MPLGYTFQPSHFGFERSLPGWTITTQIHFINQPNLTFFVWSRSPISSSSKVLWLLIFFSSQLLSPKLPKWKKYISDLILWWRLIIWNLERRPDSRISRWLSCFLSYILQIKSYVLMSAIGRWKMKHLTVHRCPFFPKQMGIYLIIHHHRLPGPACI